MSMLMVMMIHVEKMNALGQNFTNDCYTLHGVRYLYRYLFKTLKITT
jgi:hypothetical protein